MNSNYSTQKISENLVDEIKTALQSVKSYGSIEIYIQNGIVTQITIRNINNILIILFILILYLHHKFYLPLKHQGVLQSGQQSSLV